KRDGRVVPFDPVKITDAIFKAARAVGGSNREIAENLTVQVINTLLKSGYAGLIPTVEEVQDVVEKVLIENGHARTAKAYILYRDRRTRIREAKSELMDVVKEILVETNRENANVSNSPSAKMLQIAMAASKKYYLSNLIPEEFAQAHQDGSLHIHDLDYYSKTLNCLQIDLTRLLKEGFNTGYGYIRPPKRIASAAAQAAIILQSNQNDMFGGQSFPHFDRSMGEIIASFREKSSYEEIYQAMEGLIYNLNTMHSLSGLERIWVYDKSSGDLFTPTMAEFHEIYQPGRYQALSINYQSGATELKDITATFKHKNVHKLFSVRLKSGQKVTVTDNHSMITVDDQGHITTAPPAWLRRALVPREMALYKENLVFDLSCYPRSYKYSMNCLELTPALAKIMGLYVAEGSVDGSTLYLALFDPGLEAEVEQLLKQIHPGFSVRLRTAEGKSRDIACNVGRQFAAFLADKCGQGAVNKRVPAELFFARPEVVQGFLDGYLSGDGTVGSNRIVAGTVSREMRDGLQLLFFKLGIPVSIREAIPQTQYANANERCLISVGGYYCDKITLSSKKGENLVSKLRVVMEQTPYDYEFLRPLIKEVYGVFCENARNYRLKPNYLYELAQDLGKRILTETEKAELERLASEDFWFNCLNETLPTINTTEKYHLSKMLQNKRLPRFSKYLPVFFAYKDMLKRFFLPDTICDQSGSRINNNCKSPGLVMLWACKILEQNSKMVALLKTLRRVLRFWPVQVRDVVEETHEPYVYDIAVADNENFLTASGVFVHNSRAGAQVPFSSLNLGTDTTEEGRAVTRAVLEAFQRGLGRGESPIFPNLVFRVKEGVNFNPGDPNYDLFRLALAVAARRMNPTFSFMDSSFNRPYGDEVAYMGCRTRVIGNRHGPEVSARRGNIAPVTLNLPRVALECRGNIDLFFVQLDRLLRLGARQLLHRYEVLSRLRVRDLPFLMGEKLYLGSEELGPDDTIQDVIRHGTLAIGFIGLAETLQALIGKHHGEDDEALQLGLNIVNHIRRRTDSFAEEFDLNFVVVATPAEGLAGRFVAIDRERFGILPGVTDKAYYTNSFHIPVNYALSYYDKIKIEGAFHKYCNAGHISYVELEAPPLHNVEAVERIVRHMAASDVGYGGINFPLDECCSCAFSGVIEGECPRCGSEAIRRIRRITGYLSTEDRFNEAKHSELKDRRPHIMPRELK
ncbi:MAG TPA: anaerobic ribonucleoside-triphosphate reductase, partial [Bacillota bacterium]|nr:anaerobic ribonucleoside-triphosphate reductase [Bacillota bacterium]